MPKNFTCMFNTLLCLNVDKYNDDDKIISETKRIEFLYKKIKENERKT